MGSNRNDCSRRRRRRPPHERWSALHLERTFSLGYHLFGFDDHKHPGRLAPAEIDLRSAPPGRPVYTVWPISESTAGIAGAPPASCFRWWSAARLRSSGFSLFRPANSKRSLGRANLSGDKNSVGEAGVEVTGHVPGGDQIVERRPRDHRDFWRITDINDLQDVEARRPPPRPVNSYRRHRHQIRPGSVRRAAAGRQYPRAR